MLADRFIGVDLPYAQYWLPLAIGMGVGMLTIATVRMVGSRGPEPLPPPPPKPDCDPFTYGSATESRKSLRRGGNPVEIYIARMEDKENPLTGWVVDRSMGGLCLTLPTQVDTGTFLSIMPINNPASPWVDVEVRSSRKISEGFEVGCQFVRTPPWAVLLMFG